jgi:hypothetical protein
MINEDNPEVKRATGELPPVRPNNQGAPNLVSVLVSVVDALTPKPLLHPQLGMEPMAGIVPSTSAPFSNVNA